jgi:hypothetical protein
MDKDPVDIEAVPKNDSSSSGTSHFVVGIVLCVVGCLVASVLTGIGCALMAAGAWLVCAARPGASGKGVAALCCLAPLAVLCVASWENLGSYALAGVACALMIALVLPGRFSVTSVCLCILATSGIIAAADEIVLLGMGSNIVEYVQTALSSLSEQLGSTSVLVAASYESTIELMGRIWPLMYVSQGAFDVLLGLIALAVAKKLPYRRLYESFLRFTVPLWGLVALGASIVLVLMPQLNVPYASVMLSIGLCVVLCLRVLYFLQGIAVSMSIMQRRNTGQFARIMIIVMLLLAEFGFYVVSVFGVIDSFAHFRRIEKETVAQEIPDSEEQGFDETHALGSGGR